MIIPTFDYVIIGAGSAGCVLANRLTENPATSVLLQEAGGDDNLPAIAVPAAFPTLLGGPADWAYVASYRNGSTRSLIAIPRGRALGGSSSVNAMIYIRGTSRDFDDWQAAGADGWSFREVLPSSAARRPIAVSGRRSGSIRVRRARHHRCPCGEAGHLRNAA